MLLTFKRSAFTLVEVVVSMGVMLLLMGCLATLVAATSRYHQQSRAFQQVMQQANLSLRAVVDPLQNSRPGRWSYSNLPVAHLLFLSPSPPYATGGGFTYDPQGNLIWRKYLGFRMQNQELLRDELVSAGLPSSTPPTVPNYADFTWSGAQSRVVGRNLSAFLVETGDTVESVLVSLTTRQETSSSHMTQLNLKTQVFLKNRF